MSVYSKVDIDIVEAILAGVTHITRRLEIYESDGKTLWLPVADTPRMIDGSVTVDYSRAERRAVDLTLDNSDGVLKHDPFGFWYDKILKVYRGVEYTNQKTQPAILIIEEPANFLAIYPLLRALGYIDLTVATSVQDLDELYGFDIIIANSGAGAVTKNTLLQSAYNAGFNIFTTGSGNTSASVPLIGTDIAKSDAATWTVNPYTAGDNYLRDRWTGFSLTLNTTTGRHVTALAAGVKPVGTWTWNGVAGYTSMLKESQGGSRWFHLQPAPWPQNIENFKVLIRNAIEWLYSYQDTRTYESQVGEFMIDQIDEPSFPKTIQVTGRDYTKKLLRSKFTSSLSFNAGLSIDSVIRAMAANAGITKFSGNSAGYLISQDVTFAREDDRWKAISDIATAAGVEVYFSAEGYLVTRPFQDPVTSPATVALAVGEPAGNLVEYKKSSNDSRIFNRITVTGEDSESLGDGVFFQATLENREPTSPTRVQRLGPIDYFYTSAFFTSNDQCLLAAQNMMRILALEEYNLDFSSLVFPWLEAGDIAEFIDPDKADFPQRFLLTSFSMPLGLGAMSGTAKRVTIVGDAPDAEDENEEVPDPNIVSVGAALVAQSTLTASQPSAGAAALTASHTLSAQAGLGATLSLTTLSAWVDQWDDIFSGPSGATSAWAARNALTWSNVGTCSASDIASLVNAANGVGCLPTENGPELGTVGRTTVSTVTTFSGTGLNLYYENYDFNELVQVAAGASGTVRFRNCRFRGKVSSGSTGTGGDYGMIHWIGNHTLDAIVEDSDLIPQNPTYKCNGFFGHHLTIRRCRIENNCDNGGIHNTANNTQVGICTIELNYFGRMLWKNGTNDPNHADGSHTDQIEIQSGQSGVTIRGNYMYTYHNTSIGDSPWTRVGDSHVPPRATSAIQLAPYTGASQLRNIIVNKNYILGGEYGLNATNPNNGGAIGSFTDNVFGAGVDGVYQYHSSGTKPSILDFNASSSATITGNTLSNGTAADVYGRFGSTDVASNTSPAATTPLPTFGGTGPNPSLVGGDGGWSVVHPTNTSALFSFGDTPVIRNDGVWVLTGDQSALQGVGSNYFVILAGEASEWTAGSKVRIYTSAGAQRGTGTWRVTSVSAPSSGYVNVFVDHALPAGIVADGTAGTDIAKEGTGGDSWFWNNSSAVMWDMTNGLRLVSGISNFIPNDGDTSWYWSGSKVMVGNNLYVFPSKQGPGSPWTNIGRGFFKFSWPNATVAPTYVSKLYDFGTNIEWGAGAVVISGYVYFFGSYSQVGWYGVRLYLARVAVANIDNSPTTWEFWTTTSGGTWATGSGNLTSITNLKTVIDESTGTESSVSAELYNGVVRVTSKRDGPLGSSVSIWESSSITGTYVRRDVYSAPYGSPTAADQSYLGQGHYKLPKLSNGKTLVSVSRNQAGHTYEDYFNNPTWYRPTWAEVTTTPAPAGSSALTATHTLTSGAIANRAAVASLTATSTLTSGTAGTGFGLRPFGTSSFGG